MLLKFNKASRSKVARKTVWLTPLMLLAQAGLRKKHYACKTSNKFPIIRMYISGIAAYFTGFKQIPPIVFNVQEKLRMLQALSEQSADLLSQARSMRDKAQQAELKAFTAVSKYESARIRSELYLANSEQLIARIEEIKQMANLSVLPS